MIPYHRPLITEEEIQALSDVLRSGWLTAGRKVEEFESVFSEYKQGCGSVAVSSCTAGLFLLVEALRLKPGDEVITTSFTYAATVNVIIQHGGIPVLADIDPETLNLDPADVERKISSRTRAIICVHLGGNPCDMDALCRIAETHQIALIEDCAHALETTYRGKASGSFGMGGSFSFYPTKNITAAEGGMIVSKDPVLLEKFRILRRHGVDAGTWERESDFAYRFYDVVEPGYKMNMTDLQAALGIVQLGHVHTWRERRKKIAAMYDAAFSELPGIRLQKHQQNGEHALHLYILRMEGATAQRRNRAIEEIQKQGVQLSVNYTPVHRFSWYRKYFSNMNLNLPQTEACGDSVFSLPFYPGLSDQDVEQVCDTVSGVLRKA